MVCLACDFGGSSVKYALIDERAEMLEHGKASAPLDSLENFAECVCELHAKYAQQIDGIALSIPGVIDVARGIHLGSGAYGSILKGKPVVQILSEKCGTKVSVENDGKCGALAELWQGALADVQDGAVLILGTAVGGGVVTKGGIQRGATFMAGEFSYAITGPEEYGPLSQAWMNIGVIGMVYKACKLKNIDLSIQDAGNLLIKYDALMKDSFPTFSGIPQKIKVNGEQIFQWLKEGDPDARIIYDQFLHSLAVLINNIQLCFSPERIVLGGGLSRAGRLLPDLQAKLERLYHTCLIPAEAQSHLYCSKYLDECNLLGATYNFLKIHGGEEYVS